MIHISKKSCNFALAKMRVMHVNAEWFQLSTLNFQLKVALVAQLVEQLTLNQWVKGSNPFECTNQLRITSLRCCPYFFVFPYLNLATSRNLIMSY